MKGGLLTKTALFIKCLKGVSPGEICRVARVLGFDGLDVLVRPGYVEPGNASELLPAFCRTVRSEGLDVPLVTSDLIVAGAEAAGVFEGCGRAGVRLVRLGWWAYRPEQGYRSLLERARQDLAGLIETARKWAVKPVVQLHGGTIHPSASLAARLVDGFSPEEVGIYLDPGNTVARDGHEGWELELDIAGDYLSAVGVKNADKVRAVAGTCGSRDAGVQRVRRWVPLDRGLVPWRDYFALLKKRGYSGPLSFHSHYEVGLDECLRLTRMDLEFARSCLEE